MHLVVVSRWTDELKAAYAKIENLEIMLMTRTKVLKDQYEDGITKLKKAHKKATDAMKLAHEGEIRRLNHRIITLENNVSIYLCSQFHENVFLITPLLHFMREFIQEDRVAMRDHYESLITDLQSKSSQDIRDTRQRYEAKLKSQKEEWINEKSALLEAHKDEVVLLNAVILEHEKKVNEIF